MKTDFSQLPREEVEARITTMLLGEMPADEAAELMDFVSRDSELLKLHDELKRTISLVTEASANEQPMKLSEGRREQLLESFKMVKPPELAEKTHGKIEWRNWAAMAAMVGLLLGGAAFVLEVPGRFAKARVMAQRVRERGDENLMLRSRSGRGRASEERLELTELDVPKPPPELALNGPVATAQGGSEAVAIKQEPKLAASISENALARAKTDFGRAEKPRESAAPTKIELPVQQTAAPVQAKSDAWQFQAGQARGFGIGGGAMRGDTVERGLSYTDAEGKVQATMLPAETPGSILTVGKDATLAYTDRSSALAAQPPALTVNGAWNAQAPASDGFFDTSGLAGAKKTGGVASDALTGLPTATTATLSDSVIDPSSGLPKAAEPGARAGVSEFAERDAKNSGGGEAMGGGMGGGANMSMMYYMSNPELMKRYFPQMYSMMQKGREAGANANSGATSTGLAGFPGSTGLAVANADQDVMGRKSEDKPALTVPGLGGFFTFGGSSLPAVTTPPEQQVALGTEVKLQNSTERQKELIDASKKSELATVSGDPGGRPADNNGLVQLPQESLGLQPNDVAAEEAVRRLPDIVRQRREQLAAGRRLTETPKAPERELLRRDVAAKEPASPESKLKLTDDIAVKGPTAPAATPQPEVSTAENAFSTFSLNVSDVSFKLAAASLEKGLMPDAATVRSEEFINAFDYHDPEPQGAPIGFVWERARYPFAQGRDLLRFSVKTAASGRQAGRPLNLVLLLDNSGSMERADRVRILQECLKTLAAQLHPEDKISVVAFARTARLWVDGLPGSQANELAQRVGNLNPEGGTNLEEAMKVAYETARKHFNAGGVNRVVLLTDGAANLGDVEPESLKREVETERKKGIALDCFGIGWEGLNDELLETLSRNGDGRYGFVNTPEAAGSEFAAQLAGALQVAASDVKVQVEWNPKRVTAFRQIGYAKHQLTKEQFRDNTVDAAEIGAAEAGNALYTVQVNPAGEGPLGTVRVRFKVPGTNDYREHAWPLDYDGAPKPLENSSYTLRLAGTTSAFSEWLVSSPYATEVTTDRLLTILSGVPEHFAPDTRPMKLEWMIRQAKSLAGK